MLQNYVSCTWMGTDLNLSYKHKQLGSNHLHCKNIEIASHFMLRKLIVAHQIKTMII